jgi:hypothetical protein
MNHASLHLRDKIVSGAQIKVVGIERTMMLPDP